VSIPQVAGPKGDKGDKGDQGIPGPPGDSAGLIEASIAGSLSGAAAGTASGSAAGTAAGSAAGKAAAETVVIGMAADIAALQADATAKTAKDLSQDGTIAIMETQTTANTAAIATAVGTIAVLTGYYASKAGSSSGSNNISQLTTATKPNTSTPFFSTGLQVRGEHLTDGSTTAYSGEIVMNNANYDGSNFNSGDIVMKTANQNRMTIKKNGQIELGNISDLETELANKANSSDVSSSLSLKSEKSYVDTNFLNLNSASTQIINSKIQYNNLAGSTGVYPSYFLGLNSNYELILGNQAGPTGPQGSPGTQGVQGLQGIQGPNGTIGPQGPQGVQGQQGIQGIQGINGAIGPQGAQGPQGVQGQQGTQGIQGIQGPQGPQGNQGSQGFQGPQGSQGMKGDQGIQGIQGVQGPQGTQGIQGIQGIQGPQGTQGPKGDQGIQGPQGTQGTSGNIILPLNNTFTGTNTFNGTLTVNNGLEAYLSNGVRITQTNLGYSMSSLSGYSIGGVSSSTITLSSQNQQWYINPNSTSDSGGIWFRAPAETAVLERQPLLINYTFKEMLMQQVL
jgi:hypothetical protein